MGSHEKSGKVEKNRKKQSKTREIIIENCVKILRRQVNFLREQCKKD